MAFCYRAQRFSVLFLFVFWLSGAIYGDDCERAHTPAPANLIAIAESMTLPEGRTVGREESVILKREWTRQAIAAAKTFPTAKERINALRFLFGRITEISRDPRWAQGLWTSEIHELAGGARASDPYGGIMMGFEDTLVFIGEGIPAILVLPQGAMYQGQVRRMSNGQFDLKFVGNLVLISPTPDF